MNRKFDKFVALLKKYQMAIFTILAIAICMTASLLGYLYLDRMKKSMWNQLVADLTEITYQGGHAFEAYAEREKEFVEKISESLSAFSSDDEGAFDLLEFYALDDNLFSLLIYDENGGRLCYSSVRQSLSPAETGNLLEEFSGEGGITKPYLNLYSGQLSLGYYKKFTFADGKGALLLKGKLMQYLRGEFSLSFYNETGFSYIVDGEGDILIRPIHARSDRKSQNLDELLISLGSDKQNLNELHSLMQKNMQGTVRLSSSDDGNIIAFVPLTGVNAYLVSVVPNSAILNHIEGVLKISQTITVIVVIVFIIVVIFALATFFYRKKILAGERNIKYREQLFGLLANNTDDIYMLLSIKDMAFEYVSPNSVRVLGITQKDIQNSLDDDEMAGGSFSIGLKSLLELENGASKSRKCDRRHKKTGEIKHFVETAFRTTIDSEDKLIIILSDRTAEIQSESALKDAMESAMAANRAKSVFLSNMSHDIRTPMNAILGFTELIRRDAKDENKVTEYVNKISSSGRHLLGLINDVLDMSKIENGKYVLNIQKFDLNGFLKDLDDMMRPQAEIKEQDFSIRAENIENAHLLGDELRISQIAINIISNAIKYTPEKGKIEVVFEELPKTNANFARLRMTVADNGIGMSEEYREKLFKPFTREISSTVNAIQGTGLGMAITKNLVDLMGGTISVKSRQGVGSTFVVELELRIDENNIENTDGFAEDDKRVEYNADAVTGGTAEDDNAADYNAVDKAVNNNAADGDKTVDNDVKADDKAAVEYKAAESCNSEKAYSEKGALDGKKFLAAEDNELNFEILYELLEMRGASCDRAQNGKIAVEMFGESGENYYDGILMDIQMPEMNGFEAARAIRALDRADAAAVPIIAMTANAFAEDINASLEAGMDAHIAKPIDMDRLERVFCDIVGKRK